MSFNSETYRMNKARQEARDRMDDARDLKSRIVLGTAYDWEARRLPTLVKLARLSFHEYLGWRRIKALS